MRFSNILMGMVGFFLVAPAAHAEPRCTPSRAVITQNYPGVKAIPTSNNLLLPAGKSIPAAGQRLILTGKVMDKTCAVVPEATVELWQVSPFGRWLLAGDADLATPSATWAGAGRAYTALDGTFVFTTAFPAPVGKRAPNINIRVKSRGLPVYSSNLFFANDVRNDTDAVYKKLSGETRGDVTIHMEPGENGDIVGTIDIVLSGETPYRTY